ncbi:MAG: hypothetical protein IJ419_02310 [Agathobacter sp.]|nr:hypothetical protein [Agathobacter sp.]
MTLNFNKSNFKDESFLNVFFKSVVIRLVVVCLISALILTYVPNYMENRYQDVVEKEVAKATLNIAQLIDLEMREDIYENTINIELAKLQHTINQIPYVKDSAVILYNLTKSRVDGTSLETVVTESEDTKEWWREEGKLTYGEPKWVLASDEIEFCKKYNDKQILIETTYFMNGLLSPSSIVITNKLNEEQNRLNITNPTFVSPVTLNLPTYIKIYGNDKNDKIYEELTNVVVKADPLPEDEQPKQGIYAEKPAEEQETVRNDAIVTYVNHLEVNDIRLASNTFDINNNGYQLDCGYQLNFWQDGLLPIVLFELAAISLCLLSAYFATKKQLEVV